MESDQFSVRFWGVRGSIPCPGERYAVYGGNTPCLEVRCGGKVLVFDAGSGIHPLGASLNGDAVKDLHLYFTHCHYDHICGLPFFGPLFCEDASVTIVSGHHQNGMTTEQMVRSFMQAPFFPVGPEVFSAQLAFDDFAPGDTLTPGEGIAVRTTALNHPNGCIGYRIEYGGRAICYVSDTEHEAAGPDKNIVELIAGADVVIYDASYTADEYEQCQGYGHSTWEEGAKLCDLADAGQYVIFHHCPHHDDGFMDRMARQAAAARPGTLVAREGLTLSV